MFLVDLAEPVSRISISAGHSAAGISDCEKNSCSSDSRRISQARCRSSPIVPRSPCRRCRHARSRPTSASRLPDGVADHLLEGLVGGNHDGGGERLAKRAVGLRRRFQQHLQRQLVEQLRGRSFVQHGEARRDIGLERETGAAAACRRRGWSAPSARPAFPAPKRTAGAPARAGQHPAFLPVLSSDPLVERVVVERRPFRQRAEHARSPCWRQPPW